MKIDGKLAWSGLRTESGLIKLTNEVLSIGFPEHGGIMLRPEYKMVKTGDSVIINGHAKRNDYDITVVVTDKNITVTHCGKKVECEIISQQ